MNTAKDPGLDEGFVFLMDCEQRCSEGIIYSLATRGFSVIGLSPDRFFPARFSSHLHRRVQSPKLDNGFQEYFEFLCSLEKRGVIVPSGDLSVKFLSGFKESLTSEGFLVNVPDPDTLHHLFDKWECNQICERHDIPVAKSALANNLSDAERFSSDMTWPLIVKPTSLAGGNYVKVHSQEELKNAFNSLSNIIKKENFKLHESGILIQEWIDLKMSDNWSCDVYFDKYGELVDFVTIKRIRTSLSEKGLPTSRMYCGQIQNNTLLKERTFDLLKKQNWKGFAHVEYIFCKKRNDYVLTEVNPRLPGYSYLLSASGHEQACYYSLDLFGLPFQINRCSRNERLYYFETLRYPGDLSDGIVNYWRGHLKLKDFMRSYLVLARNPRQAVVDYFNIKDFRMTIAVQVFNLIRFGSKVMSFVKRRLKYYAENK